MPHDKLKHQLWQQFCLVTNLSCCATQLSCRIRGYVDAAIDSLTICEALQDAEPFLAALVRSILQHIFHEYLCPVTFLITLCMKLFWFCHTNSGQLFCNGPLFVIALVPGLFFGGKPDETCCHSVVASKWLKTRVGQFTLQDENTTT